jgi:hypothetical protein
MFEWVSKSRLFYLRFAGQVLNAAGRPDASPAGSRTTWAYSRPPMPAGVGGLWTGTGGGKWLVDVMFLRPRILFPKNAPIRGGIDIQSPPIQFFTRIDRVGDESSTGRQDPDTSRSIVGPRWKLALARQDLSRPVQNPGTI